MNKQEYIDTAEQELLHTYNRFSLVLDHGEGVYLYDTDKKKRIWISQPESPYVRWAIAMRRIKMR